MSDLLFAPKISTPITLPSGNVITIREQNGEDDGVLSNVANSTDGSSIHKFIANIVRSYNGDTPKLSSNDIAKWKTRDIYYTLLKSRIHSLGSEILFKYTCINETCKAKNDFVENLDIFDQDLSKAPDTLINDGVKVLPYPSGKEEYRELVLSSNKKVRYKYLTGLAEKSILAINRDSVNVNTQLTMRNLEVFNKDKWQPVQVFNIFSSKEMTEIRRDLAIHDSQFNLEIEIPCPRCQTVAKLSIITETNFFFPQ